jgi:hypothetical protein
MGPERQKAYRIDVTPERLSNPAYGTLTIEVAARTDTFHDVVFAARVDIRGDRRELDSSVQQLFEQVLARETYREEAPLSTEYLNWLDALDVEHLETASIGQHLWYDDSLYRYSLYMNDASEPSLPLEVQQRQTSDVPSIANRWSIEFRRPSAGPLGFDTL